MFKNRKKNNEKIHLEPSGVLYTVVPKEYMEKNVYFEKTLLFQMIESNKGAPKVVYV